MNSMQYASLLAIREFDSQQNISVLEPVDFYGTTVQDHIKAISAFACDSQRALSLLALRNSSEHYNLSLSDKNLSNTILRSYLRFSSTEAYDARRISIAFKEVGYHSYDFGLSIACPGDKPDKYIGRNLAAIRAEDPTSIWHWRVDFKESDTDRSVRIYSKHQGCKFVEEFIVPLEDLTYGTAECPNARSITKVIYKILSEMDYIPRNINLFSWSQYEKQKFEFYTYPRNSRKRWSPSF